MPNNLVVPGGAGSKGSRVGSRSAVVGGSTSGVTGGSRSGVIALRSSTALFTLMFGKASRVFAAFVSFHYLQDKVALPLYLFFVGAGASIFLLALQRPWKGRRVGARRSRRVILAGAMLASTLYVWTAGLRSAGPLRTMLIDGAELPLLYLFAVLSRREMPEKRRSRGAVLMLVAYALLIWDASGRAPALQQIEPARFRRHSSTPNTADTNLHLNVTFKKPPAKEDVSIGGNAAVRIAGKLPWVGRQQQLLNTYNPPVAGSGRIRDAFVEGTPLRSEIGVVLVLIASVIMQSSRSFTRRLATELGGAKRHFALSLTCATAWLAPLALLSQLFPAGGAILSLSVIGGITRMKVTSSHALGFATVGFLWLVVPYYVRAIVSTRLSQKAMTRTNVVVPFLMAAAVSTLLGAASSAGGLSWILAVAAMLNFAGISLMMAPGTKRALSELPIDSGTAPVEQRTNTATTQ